MSRFIPSRPNASMRHMGAGLRRTAPEETVTVGLNDSLWSIAADYAGAAATDWEIAAAWPQWYELNRAVIGEDPAVLLPGTLLSIPEFAQLTG